MDPFKRNPDGSLDSLYKIAEDTAKRAQLIANAYRAFDNHPARPIASKIHLMLAQGMYQEEQFQKMLVRDIDGWREAIEQYNLDEVVNTYMIQPEGCPVKLGVIVEYHLTDSGTCTSSILTVRIKAIDPKDDKLPNGVYFEIDRYSWTANGGTMGSKGPSPESQICHIPI